MDDGAGTRGRSSAAEAAPSRRPRSDPRIQERRVEVARQLGRSRRRRILTVLALLAACAGGFALLHSSLFGARHIVVTGDRRTSRAAVIRAAGLYGAPPLVDLDAAVIARRVERLPWVESARVSVSWPWDVTIRVTERVPVAAVALAAGHFAVCDPTGRVLEVVPSRPASLPLLAGVAHVPPPGGTLAPGGRELSSVAAAMPQSMVAESTSLFLSPEGVEIGFRKDPIGLLGAADLLHEKFVSLATVFAHGGLTDVAAVDVRVPTAPVLLRRSPGPIVPAIGGG